MTRDKQTAPFSAAFFRAILLSLVLLIGGGAASPPEAAAKTAPVMIGDFELFPQPPEFVPEPPTTYDYSSFTRKGVETLDTCLHPYTATHTTESGHTIKLLGAAFVYMGPANGQSLLGHVGERFVYCRDQELVDVYFDYAPLGDERMNPDFEATFDIDIGSYAEETKTAYAKSLFVDRTFDPPEAYGKEQFWKNRTIYEVWYDIDDQAMYKMLLANTERYQEQAARIRSHAPLPEYRLFSNNCIQPVAQDLLLVNPGFLEQDAVAALSPLFLFSSVKRQPVAKLIVYPSQRLFRILRLQQKGELTFREMFKGQAGDSWVLMFPEGRNPLTHLLVHPVAGAANTVTAALETAWGILTIPVNWLGRIPGLKFLYSRSNGAYRVARGLSDILSSLGEVVYLQTRYPVSTSWSSDEKTFFRGYSQDAALLAVLQARETAAPIVVSWGVGRQRRSQEDKDKETRR